jgi:hypothetical protein
MYFEINVAGWIPIDYRPLARLWSAPQGFYFPAKMMPLEFVDM